MRKREVKYEGGSVTIGSLSIKQMTEWGEKVRSQDLTFNRYQALVWSLNNAQKEDPNAKPWTEERFKEEFDSVVFELMFEHLLDFCGLKLEKVESGDNKPAGETQAASPTPSATLDAASSPSPAA